MSNQALYLTLLTKTVMLSLLMKTNSCHRYCSYLVLSKALSIVSFSHNSYMQIDLNRLLNCCLTGKDLLYAFV